MIIEMELETLRQVAYSPDFLHSDYDLVQFLFGLKNSV